VVVGVFLPKQRDRNCTDCVLHTDKPSGQRCEWGKGESSPELMVVTKWPTSYSSVSKILLDAGYDQSFYLTSALKCKSETEPKQREVKSCRPYLDYEIKTRQPKWILALGNEALLATTGHSGIMKHRGHIYPNKFDPSIKVMGTLNPAAVHISPSYATGFAADMAFFVRQVKCIKSDNPRIPYYVADTKEKLEDLALAVAKSHSVSYDVETNSLEEYKCESVIICVSLSLWNKDSTDVKEVWAVPLFHPESNFKHEWKSIYLSICKLLNWLAVRVAFNAKFDDRWSEEFGDPVRATFDPMLAAHLLDENRSKSLESLSRQELMEPSWKIDTTNLLNEPLKKVLRYNAKDTINTARLYFKLREELKKQPRLARLFMRLVMPVSNELVDSERIGVWIDRARHGKRWQAVKDRLLDIDKRLKDWVPAELPTNGKGKILQINFNTSDFLRWFIYDYLELPILEYTAAGSPSLSLAVKQRLKEAHPVMTLLIRRSKWAKYESAFFSAYDVLMDERDRVHTSFKLHVAVTGRLSSGKGDTEKALVKPTRSTNLQNVPVDPLCKGIIGAPPGRVWINADLAQIEFRIAAWMANDIAALEAFHNGDDIHRLLAAELLKKDPKDVTKEERHNTKPPNFLFLFGGYENMFIETAWREYQIVFTRAEARRARNAFFTKWAQMESWHEKQRRLVRKYGYVVSPFGRVRRLPNVNSSVETQRWHAERQAINAPVQSCASDVNQYAYLLITQEIKRRKLDVYSLGTVHDSGMYDAAEKDVAELLPIIKETMENLPLEKAFGIRLGVPIVTEIEVGHHWGEGVELTNEQIYNWQGEGL